MDCLQVRCVERATEKVTQEFRSTESNQQPSSSRSVESRDLLPCGAGRPESSTETLPQDEQGGKAVRAAKSSPPRARRRSTNTPSPPAGRIEKKQRSSCKTLTSSWDVTDKNATGAHNYHTEQINKYGTIQFTSLSDKEHGGKTRALRPLFYCHFQAGARAEIGRAHV